MAKMMVNRHIGLVREPIKRPIRKGKTAKDHANGFRKRNLERKAARAEWQNDPRVIEASRRGAEVPKFPV